MQAKAWDMFVNVDGQFGRTICPLPHAQLDNPIVDRSTVEKWDQLSCHDRFEEIKHKLTAEEQGLLVSLLLHISGGRMKESSLWDMVRSHALLMHSSDNFADVWLRYKLRDGQTALAKRMFEEATGDGLEYAFSTQVKSIAQDTSGDGPVTVRSSNGNAFRAKKIINTIPLNVLKDIEFSPPLTQRRQDAINIGHVNQMTKVHADVSNKELERWNGMRFPGLLMYGYGDGVLPNGDVHVVAFGADERDTFIPENSAAQTIEALNKIHPMDVKRLVRCPSSTVKALLLTIRRCCIIGLQILIQREVLPGGSQVTCQNTRMSSRVDTVMSFLPRPIGLMAGELLLMVLWSKVV